MASAAFRVRSSAVGHRWAYVESVVFAEACPRALCTVTTSQPWAMEARCVEVAEAVEREALKAGLAQRGAPPMAHGVLVRWILALTDEEPSGGDISGTVQPHVLGQFLDESRGKVDGSHLPGPVRGFHSTNPAPRRKPINCSGQVR